MRWASKLENRHDHCHQRAHRCHHHHHHRYDHRPVPLTVTAAAAAAPRYGHNNQPCHHLLWLFALVGEPKTTQKYVRNVIDHAYGVDFYAGDEDNGENGGWFVLAALGLYAAAPGTEEYVMGSPIFRHVKVSLPADTGGPNGARPARELNIVAKGTSKKNVYVDGVSLNGQPVKGPVVMDSALQQGGILRFVMEGEDPNSAPYVENSGGGGSGGSGGGGYVPPCPQAVAPLGGGGGGEEVRAAQAAAADASSALSSERVKTAGLEGRVPTCRALISEFNGSVYITTNPCVKYQNQIKFF